MTTNVLVTFYSTYGHVHRMALAVAEGAESVPDSTVRLRRIAELEEARKALSAQDAYVRAQQAQADIPAVTHDDLRWADGIAWGTPTRYGNMSAQMKQFIDTTGGLWLKGELEDKATGIFTSTVCRHPIRTEPANTRNRRHRWLALRTRHPSRNRRLAAAGRSRAHNRTQPRQSPCSRRGQSQGPQGKSCIRAIAWETITAMSYGDPMLRMCIAKSASTLGAFSRAEFVPGYEASLFYGAGAPRKTPAEIIEKLNREIDAGLADPKLQTQLVGLGGTVLTGSPADFGNFIANETEKWAKVIRAAGIRAE